MAFQLAILAGALLGGSVGFGTLLCGMGAHVPGEMPKAKCIVLSTIGTAIIVGTVVAAGLLLKH